MVFYIENSNAGQIHIPQLTGQVWNSSGYNVSIKGLKITIENLHPGGYHDGTIYGRSCLPSTKRVLSIPLKQDGSYVFPTTTLNNPHSSEFCFYYEITAMIGGKTKVLNFSGYNFNNQEKAKQFLSRIYINRKFGDFSSESFTVQIPGELTAQQYVDRILSNLPYSNSNKYRWELSLDYSYTFKGFPIYLKLHPDTKKFPIPCKGFVTSDRGCLVSSEQNQNLKTFTVSGGLTGPLDNLEVSFERREAKTVVDVLNYNITLNIYDKKTKQRSVYFDPMPNPRDYLVKDRFSSSGVKIDRFTGIDLKNIKKLGPIKVELHGNTSEVVHTMCCSLRGLWQNGSY